MPVVLTHDTLKLLKRTANDLTTGIGSSHLSEAIAAGLGYKTHLSLRAALDQGPTLVEVSAPAFRDRLASLGGYRCQENLLSAALHETTVRRIRKVADQFPRMTLSGLNPYVGYYRATYKTKEDWANARAEFLGSDTVEMFLRSEIWLAQCKKGAKVYRGQTSYGMKHSVERWIKQNVPGMHHYVANGAFIAAAVANGFEVEQVPESDLNCFINVATKPSGHPGITTLCDRKETYEVVAAPMLALLSEVVRGWEGHRTAKRTPETSFFLVKHGMNRIQRDTEGRVRLSSRGWSVLLTVDGGLAHLAPQHIRTAILRGDLTEFMRWYGGEWPYEHMPWAKPVDDSELRELMAE